jgi:Flp pilus assembly protein TadG
MNRRIRPKWRDARGAELLEFAMCLPLLLLVVAGIIDFGLMFQAFEVVTNSAREGARLRVLPGYNNADAQNRVNTYLNASGLTGVRVTTVTPAGIPAGGGGAPAAPGFQVRVEYTHTFLILGPILQLFGGTLANTIQLSSVSIMRAETVVAGP